MAYADINSFTVTAATIAQDVAKQYAGRTDLAVRVGTLDATLSKVTTLGDLLEALLMLEGLVCDSITAEIRTYDLDKPIREQKDRSPSVFAQSAVLFQAYYRAVSDPVVMEAVTAFVGGAAKQFAVQIHPWVKPDTDWANDDTTIDGQCATAERDFVDAAHRLVLLCLAVSARRPAGAKLLDRLVTSKAIVVVQPAYRQEPGSLLLALSPVLSASCTSTAPDAKDSLTRVTHIVVKKDDGKRAASSFDAPIWLDTDEPSAADLARQSFAPGAGGLTVSGALAAALAGSLSFDTGYRPFYTPMRIEVLHELVHAVHNANGENRKDIPLTDADTAIWDDAEEFWTIAHDEIGENAVAGDVGLPPRHGHAGLHLGGLSPASPTSHDSLSKISRKPAQTGGDKSNCVVS